MEIDRHTLDDRQFAPLPGESEYRACARYLNSNAVFLPEASRREIWLQAAWMRLTRPGVYRELRTGVRDTCSLLAKLGALAASLRGSDAPGRGNHEAGETELESFGARLAGELRALPGMAFRRFAASESAGRLRFDYLLREGVSDQRLGLRVLQHEGVFELLDSIE